MSDSSGFDGDVSGDDDSAVDPLSGICCGGDYHYLS